jgi:histidinol-phosphate aminotransferase
MSKETHSLLYVRSNIDGLKPYVAGRSTEEVKNQYQLDKVIKLGSNENPWGNSSNARKAMRNVVEGSAIYPDGGCSELITELANLYNLPQDWVLPGNGSDEIFLMIAAAFLNPGEQSVVSECTFSQYECVTRIMDGTVVKVPMKDYTYNLEGFAQAVTSKTKCLFVCNPNNPTGTYVSQENIEKLIQEIPTSCIVVLDEAYGEFAEKQDYPNSSELVNKYPKLLVTRTFSKIYGLAGIRLGYVLGNPELIEQIKKVRNFNPFNVNSMAQAGGVAALRDQGFVQRIKAWNRDGVAYIEGQLTSRNIPFLKTQGNFVCFQIPFDGKVFAEKMAQNGVILRPLNTFGMSNWCRLTVGTEEENKEVFAVLDKVWGGVGA